MLGKLLVPGRPTYLDEVGQGPIALAGACRAIWTFFLNPVSSLFFLPLSGRRPDKD